ncbi:dihydropteroate synthase [Facklamia sp. DSM 111018]|uniref:Dihydropteroate synthase n=1 Tax=Facklamia lactis TaxID=2749967 RepID=A0ABS0LNB6_9LACT|nr:dihydropteroate synthase [Facklamia lactis]MBG9979781.1 dihydropteroate synthase [Facklamia lactis]MBG9985539.1 dihydropteroate synthase [Facklamia lactis]
MLTVIEKNQAHFNFNGQTIQHGDPTIICGIVNVTPDSFSDGGMWFETQKAIDRAKELINQGCRMIDVGGESTRPGSTYVDIEEEIKRVVPVIRAIKKETDAIVSVDTWKSEVAKAAIDAGADIVNDITGLLGDPRMASVIAPSQAGAVVMINPVIVRPNHPSAKVFPQFGAEGVFTQNELERFAEMDEIELMEAYFKKSFEYAEAAGLSRDRLILDPGIGFGLTKKENFNLVKHAQLIHQWGYTCFLGVSRKRFIQNTLADAGYNIDTKTEEGFSLRDEASAALTAVASFMGVEVVRVHVGTEHHIASLIGNNIRMAETLEDINYGAYKAK